MTMRLTADFSAAPVSPGRRWTHISKRESNCQPKILSPAKQPFEKADEMEIFLATKQNRTTGGRWAPRRLREGRFSRARSGKTENGPGRKVSGVGTHGEEGRVSRERPLAAPLPLPTGPGTWLRRLSPPTPTVPEFQSLPDHFQRFASELSFPPSSKITLSPRLRQPAPRSFASLAVTPKNSRPYFPSAVRPLRASLKPTPNTDLQPHRSTRAVLAHDLRTAGPVLGSQPSGSMTGGGVRPSSSTCFVPRALAPLGAPAHPRPAFLVLVSPGRMSQGERTLPHCSHFLGLP